MYVTSEKVSSTFFMCKWMGIFFLYSTVTHFLRNIFKLYAENYIALSSVIIFADLSVNN